MRITRLLIANRGEIARRIGATARSMGIETVAVYAEADADAPYVDEADRAVALRGRSAAETYLNAEALLAAAASAGADAVHPGYGFLAERGAFARSVAAAGLVFVGPPPEVIELLGDKLAALRLMADAGVPVLPFTELSPHSAVPAGEVRFPVIVKAAAGGGGKGMRVVREPADLGGAVAAARREAGAAFGDDTVFLEAFVPNARHVEIQVLADAYGGIVHCYERECSIQRRHQKVIEESPAPGIDEELRAQMAVAALAAARAAGYRNAGTVEFILEPSRAFWFLEVNTRLQVEYPVTEAVTGLDLVRAQIAIAEGAPLPFAQEDVTIEGHAIEARLYAEDAAAGFLPASGTLLEWLPPEEPALRWDSGVETGSEVPIEFDPMLAKVVAHAATRNEAAARLAAGLERARIRGVTTNRDFLVATLRHPEFLSGRATTGFVEGSGVVRARRPSKDELAWAATAAALSAQADRRERARVLGSLPSGWRNSVMPAECVIYEHGHTELAVTYRRGRDGRYDVGIGEWRAVVAFGREPSGWVRLEAGVHRRRLHVLCASGSDGRRIFVQGPDGDVELWERPRFVPAEASAAGGALAAPMPGKVVHVAIEAGEDVAEGQLLVVMEAMKMEHRIHAPVAGTVIEVRARPGAQVSGGDLLVMLGET